MKRFVAIFVVLLMTLSMFGCSKKEVNVSSNAQDKSWDSILQEAKGTTVTFYGWGGSDATNSWIDNYLAKTVKEKYDITLKRVPMDIDAILNKMLGDKQAGSSKGTIDMVWINGENFYTAKKGGLLYGPFSDKLPNFDKYIDKNSIEVKTDFGYPVDSYEVPYGKAQLVMLYDEKRVANAPKDTKELMELVKNNPGKFTYPAPPDFTGSAFVRNVICDIVGYDKLASAKADEASVKAVIQPALDYLKELKPYLWNKGKSYPASIGQLDNMYADSQVLMSMSYNPNSIPGRINKGELPASTKSFIFEKGTVGNTHFIAMPFNAPNKSGVMAVINEIISVEAQASKYNPDNWGDLPVLDNNKLSPDEKKVFDSVKIGLGALPQDVLLKHRVPEVPANLVPIIEKIWSEEIPKDN